MNPVSVTTCWFCEILCYSLLTAHTSAVVHKMPVGDLAKHGGREQQRVSSLEVFHACHANDLFDKTEKIRWWLWASLPLVLPLVFSERQQKLWGHWIDVILIVIINAPQQHNALSTLLVAFHISHLLSAYQLWMQKKKKGKKKEKTEQLFP